MDWFASIISIIGVILNAKKKIQCWPVWILANIIWMIYSYHKHEYALVVLWAVFQIANIYGWIQWYKAKQDELSKR